MKDLQSGLRVLSEVVFLAVLGLDGFALFISVFLPLQSGTFHAVVLLDLAASAMVLVAYLTRPGVHDRWNVPLVAAPFYFIGVTILGVPQHSQFSISPHLGTGL